MKLIYSVIVSLIAVSINAAVIPSNFASMTHDLTKRAPSPYNGSGADDGSGYGADDGYGYGADNGYGYGADNGSGYETTDDDDDDDDA
ncbi:hypothetical protein BASA50_005866 [Batrachochytrium salamandrivorans]|uniref:Uncharacterized protein n=1 Tax=Batrachochytrium salamandrivorans TaxID=1357716 RepID=A0ABQ8FBE5_9FUNG|nr:hypothetical protein BASA60_000170 [Batrachochytrium salamandrivorans]KAH6578821.1 hypothetical protein BASA61_000050 [Batrachochytrium salamandrivorans]KAH6595347.1 hypothetical protein BASA50_005866 [Batrachochytrium salamandrivorans]KAH9248875.1 hypothetical protein BASA81_013438 [Batrachochytrium salamandrivorans]KAH9267810.1 hypothetical protein BASA83_009749 [Batrachochytrium salamandrivorans]